MHFLCLKLHGSTIHCNQYPKSLWDGNSDLYLAKGTSNVQVASWVIPGSLRVPIDPSRQMATFCRYISRTLVWSRMVLKARDLLKPMQHTRWLDMKQTHWIELCNQRQLVTRKRRPWCLRTLCGTSSDVTGTETLPLYKHAASCLALTVYIFRTHVVRTWGGTSNILNGDLCDFL